MKQKDRQNRGSKTVSQSPRNNTTSNNRQRRQYNPKWSISFW
ncbi:MAG: hypothetical protein ACJ71K_08335 [Nitrososphaeraceae archaeon]